MEYKTNHDDMLLRNAEKLIVPVRKSLFKRFPIPSVIIVMFGLTATSYGAERIFQNIRILNEHPLYLFVGGLLVLMFMGKLYQRIG